MSQSDLFGAAPLPELPPGMRYAPEFLSRAQESDLLAILRQLPLAPMQYLQYTARRRVASYGGQYDFSAQKLQEAQPLPAWLDPLRERAGAWAGIAPERFSQALVAEYQPGTPLGWHRDVPDFESIVGISVLGNARMKFRPYPPAAGRSDSAFELDLPPRCAYVLEGAARWKWQHSIVKTQEQRYSISLRTRRGAPLLLR